MNCIKALSPWFGAFGISLGCGGRVTEVSTESCVDKGIVHAEGTTWACNTCSACSCVLGQITTQSTCLGMDGASTETGIVDAGTDSSSGVPNCVLAGPGLMSKCGLAQESCCTSIEVTGGTFYRTYVNDGGGPAGEADPATISAFRLDKYDVTVGRFRQFVTAWAEGWRPTSGSGKHSHLNDGNGLVTTGGGYDGGAYEPGWLASDDSKVAPTNANLASCSPYSTWTPASNDQEDLPINCVNWYESYAFCIWDGGFLPSDAEWEYTAAGGAEQREYPWGSADPEPAIQYAIFGDTTNNSLQHEGECYYPGGALAGCTGFVNIASVGTATLGAGLWGQLDLAGDVLQWNLDWYAPSYADPCVDCTYWNDSPFLPYVAVNGGGGPGMDVAPGRLLRGASFYETADRLVPTARTYFGPTQRDAAFGFRCARAP
jgi:formylglycine-generating enzyme required for sulfatase activity